MGKYPKGRNGYHGHRIHTVRESSAPTLHPTTKDIAWAAGIYEGEGSIYKNPQCLKYSGIKVAVYQKETWVLHRLRELFGGTVGSQSKSIDRNLNIWRLSGSRAIGFTQTIYCLLSPHRQLQFKKAWGIA